MKAVLQRVRSAKVETGGETVGEIGQGYLLLLGVQAGDSEEEAALLAKKTVLLRVFEDEAGKMNRSVLDVDGEILAVSQFTLCADCRKGNRPSFTSSMEPGRANELYAYFCTLLKENGVRKVGKGVFGADMLVSLENDGPVTICLDTDIWRKA